MIDSVWVDPCVDPVGHKQINQGRTYESTPTNSVVLPCVYNLGMLRFLIWLFRTV